jgi:FlaA1/EpsC-like NDP-sugar epimerase
MTDVIIIGAGGHAAEIDEYIIHSQKVTQKQELRIMGFLDDDPESYARYKLSAPLWVG